MDTRNARSLLDDVSYYLEDQQDRINDLIGELQKEKDENERLDSILQESREEVKDLVDEIADLKSQLEDWEKSSPEEVK